MIVSRRLGRQVSYEQCSRSRLSVPELIHSTFAILRPLFCNQFKDYVGIMDVDWTPVREENCGNHRQAKVMPPLVEDNASCIVVERSYRGFPGLVLISAQWIPA